MIKLKLFKIHFTSLALQYINYSIITFIIIVVIITVNPIADHQMHDFGDSSAVLYRPVVQFYAGKLPVLASHLHITEYLPVFHHPSAPGYTTFAPILNKKRV